MMIDGEYLILQLLLGDNIPPQSKNKDLAVFPFFWDFCPLSFLFSSSFRDQRTLLMH